MPLSAFIIRPFGIKEVVLPGEDHKQENGERVRTSKLVDVNFDEIHNKLIAPALSQLQITANTTEAVIAAGNIREDMFHLLMTADLVVADVTLHNPNVFYELGIRHAFRDKFTFLIRAGLNEYPFDLKTDRYFQYEHIKPEASVAGLAKAVRATLTSERADSPVFRLLPRMRAEDRSRFISVPADFLEEVERARKHRRGGDLRLLAAECEDFLWEVEGLRIVGRAQFELNFMGGARSTWEEIARRYPYDVEANMILSTIYQRVSDGTRSEQALARISRLEIPDANTVAEIRALVGRNLKAKWMEGWQSLMTARADSEDESGIGGTPDGRPEIQRRALKSPLLRKAREAYGESFRANQNYAYAGMNCLSLMITEVSLGDQFPETWALVLDPGEDPGQAMKQRKEEIAKLTAALEYSIESERRRLAAANAIDFWFEIMEASFLCLTSNNPKKVAQSYFEAMLWAPRYAETSMRRALEMYQRLNVRHPDPKVSLEKNVAAALEVIAREEGQRPSEGNIVLFVGLRMESLGNGHGHADQDEKTPLKFLPRHLEDRAREEIKAVLGRERDAAHGKRILFGMAAASCGSDILFHEVCEELGVESRLFLALPRDQYIGAYVAPAGAQWVERFTRIHRSHREEAERQPPEQLDSDQVINILADSMEMPRWLQSKSNYTVGKRNAVWMLQHALVQRHLHDARGTDVTMIALWDRREVESSGGIGKLCEMAEKNGIKVLHIDCSAWLDATRTLHAVNAAR